MSGIETSERSLAWRAGGERLLVEPWGVDSVRVRIAVGTLTDEEPGALLSPAVSPASVHMEGEVAVLVNGRLRVELYRYGELRFLDAVTGQTLLRERERDAMGYPARFAHDIGGPGRRWSVEFAAFDDERLYGMGQHAHGRLNQKGCTLELHHHNAAFTIPFLCSSRGYGFLWNHPGSGRVSFGANATCWQADCAQQIDYWVCAGTSPAAILQRYAEATGFSPPMPAWAAGFWQSKLRYKTQDEVLTVAREHQRRGIPLDVLVIDYFHWTAMGEWSFDPEAFPDPAAMIAELDELGVRVCVSVWPTVNPASEHYKTMRNDDLLLRLPGGLPIQRLMSDNRPLRDDPNTPVAFYDPTNPEARSFIWQQCREHYHDIGVAAYWLDCNEPELKHTDFHAIHMHAGRGDTCIARYPNDHARAFREGLEAEGADGVLLCRSGWAGIQRYGAILWSGDIKGTWEEFRRQVTAGLNVSMSGIPWWNTDIGGFFLWGQERESPEYTELLIRWFQYGVFTPVCRLHGMRDPNELWTYGEDVERIGARLVRLRHALKPYIIEQMGQASQTGLPPMRPLFVDHPEDATCWQRDDQFHFGRELVVCPVLEPGARERRVYLPDGDWVEAATGQAFAPGWHTVSAPLDRCPVFVGPDAGLRALLHHASTG